MAQRPVGRHTGAAGKGAAERSAVNEAVSHFRRAMADLDRLPTDAARIDQELSTLTALAPAEDDVVHAEGCPEPHPIRGGRPLLWVIRRVRCPGHEEGLSGLDLGDVLRPSRLRPRPPFRLDRPHLLGSEERVLACHPDHRGEQEGEDRDGDHERPERETEPSTLFRSVHHPGPLGPNSRSIPIPSEDGRRRQTSRPS